MYLCFLRDLYWEIEYILVDCQKLNFRRWDLKSISIFLNDSPFIDILEWAWMMVWDGLIMLQCLASTLSWKILLLRSLVILTTRLLVRLSPIEIYVRYSLIIWNSFIKLNLNAYPKECYKIYHKVKKMESYKEKFIG